MASMTRGRFNTFALGDTQRRGRSPEQDTQAIMTLMPVRGKDGAKPLNRREVEPSSPRGRSIARTVARHPEAETGRARGCARDRPSAAPESEAHMTLMPVRQKSPSLQRGQTLGTDSTGGTRGRARGNTVNVPGLVRGEPGAAHRQLPTRRGTTKAGRSPAPKKSLWGAFFGGRSTVRGSVAPSTRNRSVTVGGPDTSQLPSRYHPRNGDLGSFGVSYGPAPRYPQGPSTPRGLANAQDSMAQYTDRGDRILRRSATEYEEPSTSDDYLVVEDEDDPDHVYIVRPGTGQRVAGRTQGRTRKPGGGRHKPSFFDIFRNKSYQRR